MEAEERPRKIRKLSQLNESLQVSRNLGEELLHGLGGEVIPQEDRPFKPEQGLEAIEGIDLDIVNHENTQAQDPTSTNSTAPVSDRGEDISNPPLSKNQLKKLKRKQEWEAGREYRKGKRKQKIQEKKLQKRAANQEATHTENGAASVPSTIAANGDPKGSSKVPPNRRHVHAVQLPITFIFDCGFDDLMHEKERISLAAQLTRCYSDNHRAPYKAHMTVSSFEGKLKERFDTVLSEHHKGWKGVRFFQEDFVEAARRAEDWMAAEKGGVVAGSLARNMEGKDPLSGEHSEIGETIYLSSDSDNTLTELKPYSTYIIGGLVDRNRHKGVCYKKAMDRGIKTARLPIGEYMEMTSRFVLATNHVNEIMLKWLELGDWGQAFMAVVPKRKGGVLKGIDPTYQSGGLGVEEEADEPVIARTETDGNN
ncbi:tRNA (guanine(9)-N(1))-methyltransferase [Ptychographa xylographoides]|nr:tRNA (guanine(9)-N(1))-methyltransferase [Ptychographa xylographoides]